MGLNIPLNNNIEEDKRRYPLPFPYNRHIRPLMLQHIGNITIGLEYDKTDPNIVKEYHYFRSVHWPKIIIMSLTIKLIKTLFDIVGFSTVRRIICFKDKK